ncbi:SusD/RagB family nutrient-binding outer membrane lipoprotein [Gelidibacter salicanalis]|uniref:SusD/RagB family nutrient-binding outer membrane lipoprotein n=1 Tax=Gelidibacter salicanalis TaxID=291193 RepID=A0A5C7AKU7_9FLAO|nr:SusD/RagB family nutrient-binding outer membrane lipoprotein [Gelidibacter salicanalis]TXE08534.1 SusD/RagB family nutrient-binding outer membrane lipoprotein [Gelidibacter salicanalis]
MKNKIYIFFLILSTVMSCDDYLEINENPNGATTPPIKGLLSNVTYNSAINVYRTAYTTNYYVQYFSSPNAGSTTDIQDRVSTNSIWNNIYSVSSDIYDMEKFAMENNSVEYIGVAKTLMALNMGMAVDIYGDIPYTESFSFETITPSYDDDEVVYSEILTLLDEALVAFNQTNEGEALTAANDFIHNGNIQAWKKTAEALKARYLNHLSATSKYDKAGVLDALSKSYTSNADDAALTNFQQRNPWAQVAINNAGLILDGWLSEQVVDAMNGTTYGVFDPRLPKITNPLPDGSYIGTENGFGRVGDGTVPYEVYLSTDGYYSSPESPLFIITYPELKFIEAEVQLRDNKPTEAYTAYLEGIEAHMKKLNVAQGDINSYLSNPVVAVGASNLTLKTIFKEKYIALFLNPESWVDARRNNYDYQDFTIPVNHNTNLGGQFIRRLDYPDAEYERNAANIPDVDLLTKIWWDK